MTRHYLLIAWGVLSLVFIPSCDGGDEATETDVVLSASQGEMRLVDAMALSPSTVVSELAPSQHVDFCSISLSQLARYRAQRSDPSRTCIGEGLYAIYAPGNEEDETSCEEARDACLEISSPYVPPEPITCDETHLSQLSTCAISIEEYEACIAGIQTSFDFFESTLSCEATMEEAMELQSLYLAISPPVCDVVRSGCELLAQSLP